MGVLVVDIGSGWDTMAINGEDFLSRSPYVSGALDGVFQANQCYTYPGQMEFIELYVAVDGGILG